jgi:hypothetical protein
MLAILLGHVDAAVFNFGGWGDIGRVGKYIDPLHRCGPEVLHGHQRCYHGFDPCLDLECHRKIGVTFDGEMRRSNRKWHREIRVGVRLKEIVAVAVPNVSRDALACCHLEGGIADDLLK